MVLWLDCDREGENIAFEVRSHFCTLIQLTRECSKSLLGSCSPSLQRLDEGFLVEVWQLCETYTQGVTKKMVFGAASRIPWWNPTAQNYATSEVHFVSDAGILPRTRGVHYRKNRAQG